MKGIIIILIMVLLNLLVPLPAEKGRNHYSVHGSFNMVRNLDERNVTHGHDSAKENYTPVTTYFVEPPLEFEGWMTDPRKFFTVDNSCNNH